MCPCSSSNSGPATPTIYALSLVVVSRYALPMSAAETFMLLSLARNMSLKDLAETTPE